MEYKILVIDDDEPIHIITKVILGKEFRLEHARNGQEAIDMLAEQKFDLILSDIHMPGIRGLEFLESLVKDAGKRQIPVLIMSNLPTVEKEKKALNLDAADFFDKILFTNSKEEILERVRMKLVMNPEMPDLNQDLISRWNKLIGKVMTAAIKADFRKTVETLCKGLDDQFKTDYISFWSIQGDEPVLLSQTGSLKPENYTGNDLKSEHSFKVLTSNRKPYLTNHLFQNNLGIMNRFSGENDLPAEIGVPLFAVNERTLLMHNREVPDDAALFGLFFLKRNKPYSSKEFEMVSHLLIQTGSILWRLFAKNHQT